AISAHSPANESSEADRPSKSPLDNYLGRGAVSFENGMTVNIGGWDSTAKPRHGENLDQARRYEKLVAQCMNEAGFEYTPRVPSASGSKSSPDPYSLSADEFAAQYGYGVSTLRSSQPASGASPRRAGSGTDVSF